MNAQSKRPVGLLFLGLSLFFAYRSFKVFSGELSLPYDCSGKGRLVCEFVNIVFELNGSFAVGVLTIGASLFFLVIAYPLVVGDKKISKSDERPSTQTVKELSKHNQNKRQTLDDVLVDGHEPTAEFLEELNAVNNAPPLSDGELEKQALSK